jgi:quercetin dioxygenase-like cupin family protein
MLLKQQIEKFSINISEEEMLSFLKISKRWPIRYLDGHQSTIEIINNLGNKQYKQFFDADGYLDFDKWKHFYDLGYTSIISNILDLNEELRTVSKIIENITGSKINGNFYFSKPGQIPSFGPHTHSYPVIVKQIYGNSSWINGDQKLTLKPQESILIPANTVHQVVAKQDKKLSLTLNME